MKDDNNDKNRHDTSLEMSTVDNTMVDYENAISKRAAEASARCNLARWYHKNGNMDLALYHLKKIMADYNIQTQIDMVPLDFDRLVAVQQYHNLSFFINDLQDRLFTERL